MFTAIFCTLAVAAGVAFAYHSVPSAILILLILVVIAVFEWRRGRNASRNS